MTREKAIKIIKEFINGTCLHLVDQEALETLIPELIESEDERVRKSLIEFLTIIKGISESGRTTWAVREDDAEMCKSSIAYLEKQKENIEKEYVFRPLAGTDINSAVLQAIRRADEGDRLVLAFNGAYIPVRKGVNANKIVDIYDAFIEKQKEASKAIEAVERIDKYIDLNLANAHDMKDSNPDKKYYRGWDDALGEMARILQDVYSGEKQEEEEGYEAIPVESTLEYKLGFKAGKESEKQKETSINWMKSDNVKNPDKPYIDKVGMFYTTDGRMCYASEIEKQRDENAKDSFERGIKVGMIRQQKEQNPIKWTDLTWKDIVELEGIINNVHYDFSAGIGQESFGKEVLERFRSTKGIEYLDEAEQKCWRIVLPQPYYAFEEGQKERKLNPDKEKLIRHCIGLILTDATDERFKDYGLTLKDCLTWLGEQKEQKPVCEDCAMYLSGNCIHPNGKCENVKSKQEWSEWDESCWNLIWDILDGSFICSKEGYKKASAWFLQNCPKGTKSLRPQKLDVSKLENYDPVEVLNKIKTEWPMAWEKVVGKQEWSEEDKRKLNRIYSIIGWAMDEHAFSSCKKLLGDKEGVELQDFLRSIAKPKQEWSEEDKDKVAQYLHDRDGGMLWSTATEITGDILDMLRPSWKPSEHQMSILKSVKDYVGKGSGYWGEALGSLIDDLEKL